MSYDIFQPVTSDEAIELLSASPAPFDSPTQHRYRSLDHLEYAFDADRRRPEWVWAVRDKAGQPAAVVGGLRNGAGIVLDHLGARDVNALRVVLRAATEYAHRLPDPEATLFVPDGVGVASPRVQAWAGALEEAGWQLLAERHHYEFLPEAQLATGVATTLRLEPLTSRDDPRLLELHGEIMLGTLDAHDVALIERVGHDAATRESLDYLLDADPWECIRLAFADSPEPVGYVSWHAMEGGRGFVVFVGVAHAARGRGYGRELLVHATRGLMQAGSTTLIADTDSTNTPMVAAFADIGWPRTETRTDFIPKL